MYKGLLTTLILTLTSTATAGVKTICGPNDDRVPSFESKIGRLSVKGKHLGCTATLISDNCAITAGHCKEVLEIAEFNTPASVDGKPQGSASEDVYEIDQDSIKHQDEGPGKDWAVFKFKRNAITGKLPGELQGHYNVSFSTPKKGIELMITGYGRDSADAERNFAQQTNTGNLESVGSIWRGKSVLEHTVDTMGGNSGSSIIDVENDEIIGIHTHGGCHSSGGSNMGTLIAKHSELKAAIKACLGR